MHGLYRLSSIELYMNRVLTANKRVENWCQPSPPGGSPTDRLDLRIERPGAKGGDVEEIERETGLKFLASGGGNVGGLGRVATRLKAALKACLKAALTARGKMQLVGVNSQGVWCGGPSNWVAAAASIGAQLGRQGGQLTGAVFCNAPPLPLLKATR